VSIGVYKTAPIGRGKTYSIVGIYPEERALPVGVWKGATEYDVHTGTEVNFCNGLVECTLRIDV
jgi:hypothetical protein